MIVKKHNQTMKLKFLFVIVNLFISCESRFFKENTNINQPSINALEIDAPIEVVETIIQRPPAYAHLGDSVRVQFFKQLLKDKDTLKIPLKEHEIPKEVKDKYLYADRVFIYSSFYLKEVEFYKAYILLDEDKNTLLSKLEVEIKNIPSKNHVDLKLVLKHRNMLVNVFFDKKKKLYSFDYNENGKALLPQKEKAVLIAVCYANQDVYFASKEIETKPQMKHELSLDRMSIIDMEIHMKNIFGNDN
jgi:hypothetical protein